MKKSWIFFLILLIIAILGLYYIDFSHAFEIISEQMNAISANNLSTGYKTATINLPADLFGNTSWLIILAEFWVLGVLLGLTPCAITLILIIMSISHQRRADDSKYRTITLSLTYILSLAVVYFLLGLIAATIGFYAQSFMHKNWVIGSFSAIFIILGLVSLGLFNMQIPTHWLKININKITRQYNAYIQVVEMSILATLIALPCVLSPLIGVLTYIATTGNVMFGGISLFFTGLGFGTPLIIIQLFGSKLLQNAGEWQQYIKHIFGLFLLGIAIWMLGKIIPSHFIMYLWAGLFIFTAIHFGLYVKDENDQVNKDDEAAVCSLDGEEVPQKGVPMKNINAIIKMVCLLILLYGIILFIGALLGNDNPLSPLEQKKLTQKIILNSPNKTKKADANKIQWKSYSKNVYEEAKKAKRPMIFFIKSESCHWCEEMLKTTFNDGTIIELINNTYFAVMLDIDGNMDVVEKYKVTDLPTFIFFDQTGKMTKIISGFKTPDQFAKELNN